MTKITIHVESEPHSENLEGVLLNRPAPRGGAFLVDQRLPGDIWKQMKMAGASYYSREDLEELDMFFSEPGWRYSLAAIEVLLRHGCQLVIRDSIIDTADQLQALFAPEATAAYWRRVEDEKAAAEQAKREAEEQQRLEREHAKAEYLSWQEQTTAGLFKTFVRPHIEVDWKPLHSYDGPGSWYTTGDSWSVAEINGEKIYKNSYGNACAYYLPAHLVEEVFLAEWQENTARWGAGTCALSALNTRLTDPNGGVIRSEYKNWIVDHFGEETLAEMARKDAPIEAQYGAAYTYAAASKKYRVPLLVRGYNKTYVGYGDPQDKDFEPVEVVK